MAGLFLACGFVQDLGAQVHEFYWKDGANNGDWESGGSQWYSSETSGLVGAPKYNGGARLFFESVGNTTTTINLGGGTGGAPAGWLGLNRIFTQNSSAGKVYTINSGTGISGIFLYNKIETLNIGTPAGLIINSQVQLGDNAEINAVAANVQLGNLLFNGKTLNSYGNKQLNITGVMSGTGAYNIKNQGLTVTYSGAGENTFSGSTTVETTSTLVLNKSANVAAIAGTLTINSGGTVRTDSVNQLSNQLITVDGTLNLNGNGQSAALAGAGSVTLGAGTLTINNTLTDTFSGIISGTGGVTKTGVGTQILSNTNTYSGATTITHGILQLNGSTHASSTVGIGTEGTLSGSGTVNGNATLTGNGVINKSSGTIAGTLAVTGGNWNGAGTVTGAVTSSSGTLTIGSGANLTANGGLNVTGGSITAAASNSTITGSVNYATSASSTFGGIFAGSGNAVTINNPAGTLTLAGANTYAGATSVNAGKLLIGTGGSLGNTAVTVGGALANGTPVLGGGGTIGGATVISEANGGAAGTHAIGIPGVASGVGTQTFSSTLTYGSGSIFEWDLIASTVDPGANEANSGSYDRLIANGAAGSVSGMSAVFNIVLGGNSFATAFWDTHKSWTDIFTGPGTPTNLGVLFSSFSGSGIEPSGLVSGRGQFSFNGTSTLTWTAVPEPTNALAGVLLGAGLLRRRRR